MTDAAPKRTRKTLEQKLNDIRTREAWRLTRAAEKLEAKANALRKEAAALEAQVTA